MRKSKLSVALSLLLVAATLGVSQAFVTPNAMVMAKEGVVVGDKAPEFELPDQDGKKISLKDYLGQKAVVLYFYPKDNTKVCTAESCGFRDSYQAFKDAGAEVLGVSSDDAKSHVAFASEYKLPFKLLTDADKKVLKLYGVPSATGEVPRRVTYVIDKKGVVRLTFESAADADKHVSEALRVIKEVQAEKSNG